MSKAITSALRNFLATHKHGIVQADLYQFTFVDGLILRLTSFSSDVIWQGNRYNSLGPRIQRGRIQWAQGLQVQELDVKIAATTHNLANYGLGYQSAMAQGLWDGATATLDRVYFSNPPHIGSELQPDGSYSADKAGRGKVNLFTGRVAEIDAGPLNITLKLHSLLELLNMQVPRQVFEPNCRWTLYDSGCGLLHSNFQVSGTVQAGSTNTRIFISNINVPPTAPQAGIPLPPGWLMPGSIQFTTGRLSGASRSISFHQPASGTGSYEALIASDRPFQYFPFSTSAAPTIGTVSQAATVHGGVSFGQPSIVSATSAGSTFFDGSTGWIAMPGELGPTSWQPLFGGWTMEFWIQPAVAGFVGLFASQGFRNYDYGTGQGGIEIFPKNPLVTPVLATPNIPNHVVIQVTGSVELAVYINDSLVASAGLGVSSLAIAWNGFQVGRIGLFTALATYGGYLQAMALYPYPLTESQIANHFTVGSNVGANVPVAYVDLLTPLPFAPLAGDSFNAFAGCDLSRGQCQFKFGNLNNFGGQPSIPAPDAVLSFSGG